MTGARKKVSQREAVRNRREMKRLREFVDAIRGTVPEYQAHVVTVTNMAEQWRARAEGMAWGAKYQIVFVARFDGDKLHVYATRTPEPINAR